ncbi:hypothetical protein [Bradyrhizobium rifense]|uniref:hypothetical protein n=1 Tax=Bradyrhizobium rifense TaxID=515499 RepID=UPI001AEF0D65|nr:hypothetical protein [Bradyrhizobium rifense]
MAKYLAVVGGALAVLLLIAGWSLPELPDRFSDRPNSTGAAAIRIASERKWPEKVVLDTSQPTFFSPSIDVAPARDLVERLPDDRTDQPVVAPQADAAAKPDVRPAVAEHPPVRTRHRRSRAIPSVRVARARSPNELQGPAEACCWFEPMDRRALSRPASRNRLARRDSWTEWHFPETN